MKTRILFLALLFPITAPCIAQNYYIGAALGWHHDVFHLAETNDFFKSNLYVDFANPMVNLNFSVLLDNGVSISSGIGYYKYKLNYRLHLAQPLHYVGEISFNTHDAITIPVTVGYNCNIWKNRLFINLHSGISFDIYSNGKDLWEEYNSSYLWRIDFENAAEKSCNILVSNKIAIQYFTKFNMGIALFGGYHIGLLKVWKHAYGYFNWHSGQEVLDTQFLSNGSYWQFGIELGYKFVKKKKISGFQ